jgi:hypothetical protein
MEAYYEKGQLDKAIGPFLEKRMQEMEAYFTLTRLPVAGNKGLRSAFVPRPAAPGQGEVPGVRAVVAARVRPDAEVHRQRATTRKTTSAICAR